MEFFRPQPNGDIIGLAPASIDSEEDLLKVIKSVKDVANEAARFDEALAMERLKTSHPDPAVRELAKLSEQVKDELSECIGSLVKMEADLKASISGELESRRDLFKCRAALLVQEKVINQQLDAIRSMFEINERLKVENERLRALGPSSDRTVEVMPEGFSVGEVAERDSRSILQKLADGYWDAWRDHSLLMGAAHLAGLWVATSRSENRALREALDDSIDENEETMLGLWAAQDENEALALEVEDKTLALQKSDARRAELEGRSTTEVHVHEGSKFSDGQLETLGSRLEGRVDRSVQTELRTNTAKYRGARGERGTAGKQGRDGRDSRSTHTKTDVHHHHHRPIVKSTTKPVEVRTEVITLQPRTPPGELTDSTKRLIDSVFKKDEK